MNKYLSVIIVALTLVVCACSSVDCPVQNTVETVYHAYKRDGRPDTLADTLTIFISRKNGTDSILLNRSLRTTSFHLPISYKNPEDTLLFEFKDTMPGGRTILDSVFITKTDMPQFESVDCHIAFFHNITGVRWTRGLIDSIAINNASVNYDSSKEHFHIYFKARR